MCGTPLRPEHSIEIFCSRRTSKVEETQSNSTDSTEVSGAGLEVENRREKLFIIDMLKGGDADNKPEKVTVDDLVDDLVIYYYDDNVDNDDYPVEEGWRWDA